MSKVETRNHLLWPLQLSICKMAIIMDYVRSIFSFLVLFLVTEFTDLLEEILKAKLHVDPGICNSGCIFVKVHSCVKFDQQYPTVRYENILLRNYKAFTFPNHSPNIPPTSRPGQAYPEYR